MQQLPQENIGAQTPYFRLSELNSAIKESLELTFPDTILLVAEISELRCKTKGHCYLNLVEREDEQTIAQMKANIWAYAFRKLSEKFETATGETLKDGMEVLISVNVTFHEVYGLSLNIKDIDPTYSLGEMARKKKEVIERLSREGLINLNKALPLPLVPQRIAVISSSTAAGYGDFINHLEGNPFGYRIHHKLYQSLMQGQEAEMSILASLDEIREKAGLYDAVVIIRGGGSQIDLSCFDSYRLAAEVANFPLPVITGIGHERDDTVVDTVAHTKCKTPTDVAQFVVSGMRSFEERVLEARRRLMQKTKEILKEENHRVGLVAKQLRHIVASTFHGEHTRLHSAIHRLIHGTSATVNARINVMQRYTAEVRAGARLFLQSEDTRLKRLEQAARLLDPVNILKRGYSITYLKDRVIKDAGEAAEGDLITTRLYNGLIKSRVEGQDG
jgi:exodeoxyribonuclease VII large subunit